METDQVQDLINEYAENNMAKLKQFTYPILIKFGGISQKDYDDFYSIANEQLWIAAKEYDELKGIPFKNFLYLKISGKFKTYMTKRNRMKRKGEETNPVTEISLDTFIGGVENTPFADIVASNFDMERELGKEFGITDKASRYLNNLPKTQRKIVELLMESYRPAEIQKILELTRREYTDHLLGIRAYENISILF